MRLAATIAGLLGALALAGSSAAATRDPKQPQQRHSAADTRRASAIALVRSDFASGWTLAPEQKPQPPCSVEPDESALVETGRVNRTFLWKDGITQIGSDVAVFATPAQARTDWRLSTLAVTRACLLETLHRTFGRNVTVRMGTVVSLAQPRLAGRTLHFRFVYDLHRPTATIRGVTELIAVGAGRFTAVLHSFSVGKPLPSSALTALATVLARRVLDAAGGV